MIFLSFFILWIYFGEIDRWGISGKVRLGECGCANVRFSAIRRLKTDEKIYRDARITVYVCSKSCHNNVMQTVMQFDNDRRLKMKENKENKEFEKKWSETHRPLHLDKPTFMAGFFNCL